MDSQTILVSVINRKKDLEILLRKKWYRIPVAKLPARAFDWLAFYQTSALGNEGKQVRYYAKVKKRREFLRKDLLPDERDHPRYNKEYYKFELSDIKELPRPIQNSTSMRFIFGFTTMSRLKRFRSLHTLFGIRPLELIFKRILKKRTLPFFSEYPIFSRGRVRYRLDMAIFCKKGKIDIECDMPKHHLGRRHLCDLKRNRFLRRRGWTVLRFSDEDILYNINKCLGSLGQTISRLGGIC